MSLHNHSHSYPPTPFRVIRRVLQVYGFPSLSLPNGPVVGVGHKSLDGLLSQGGVRGNSECCFPGTPEVWPQWVHLTAALTGLDPAEPQQGRARARGVCKRRPPDLPDVRSSCIAWDLAPEEASRRKSGSGAIGDLSSQTMRPKSTGGTPLGLPVKCVRDCLCGLRSARVRMTCMQPSPALTRGTTREPRGRRAKWQRRGGRLERPPGRGRLRSPRRPCRV